MQKKFLGLVAEICEACAAKCEKHQHMKYCKLCAQAYSGMQKNVVKWKDKNL